MKRFPLSRKGAPHAGMRQMVFAILALVLIAGCDNALTTTSADTSNQLAAPTERPKISIALLGDHVRVDLGQHLASDGSLEIVAPSKDADAVAIAAAAHKADFVFLVTDATQGPLPVHREHSMILRQLGIRSIGLMFANTEQLAGMSDAVELLELEELEVREVLNAYALPGDHVTCFHDARLPKIESARQLVLGIPAAREWLKQQTRRSRPALSSNTVDSATTSIYLMSEQESMHSRQLVNGDSVNVFINGNARTALVHSDSKLLQGASSHADLQFSDSVVCAMDDRFIVIVGDHAIGAGTVTKVAP